MLLTSLRWLWIADHKRITNVTHQATADGRMVDYVTLRVEATRAGTGIAALLIDARMMTRTFRIDRTLGTTIRRGTLIVGQTGAGRSAAYVAAL